MLRDDPGDLLAHVGTQYCGGDGGVVIGRELIADVMHQCRDHQLIVSAIAPSPCRRLQRVLQPADPVTLQSGAQLAQRVQDDIRQAAGIPVRFGIEEFIFLTRAVFHLPEGH